MKYFTNCSQCGQELDETVSATLYQEMMSDKKLGKWL
jgi:transcription initiation factor IIE alpha subunit